MPIYFQKISNKKLEPNGSFYVKDSKGCNITMGALFLVAFLGIVYVDNFNTGELSIYQMLYFSIIPAVYLIRRAIVNKTIITINKNGFYYFEKLITNWHNFIDAVIIQDEENRGIPYDVTDRFMLLIRYGKIGHSGFYGRKILMTAVMDKSEEEIMAAIKFYYEHRTPDMIIPYNADESPQTSPTQQLLLKSPNR
jgi:hypothetical protein